MSATAAASGATPGRAARAPIPTASQQGLMSCHACGQLNRPAARHDAISCARCHSPLHWRKPYSLQRSWAFLVAAVLLYIPANMLPVMSSGSLFLSQSDTILSGAIYLWKTGSWVLAVIVFVASIVVPGAKILSLAYLLVGVQRRWTTGLQRRARLYRVTAYIGRWSMVDIFVGALLVSLVQFGPFASIGPGPGAIAFGAVVVLTMLASMSFDPRLTWDVVDGRHG